MSSAKYLYQEPKGSREQLEAISFQLGRTTGARKGNIRPETIQDHLIELVSLTRQATSRHEREPMKAEMAETTALYVFAAICTLLIWHGSGSYSSDIGWFNENRFFLKAWGIGLSTVFVGINIERTGLAGVVWRYGVTKFLASVALSTLVVCSAGQAASLVNGVFGIDASSLPYTRNLVAGWIAFRHLAWPFMFILGVFAAGHLWIVLSYFYMRLWPAMDSSSPSFSWHSLGVAFLSAVVIGNVSSWMFHTLDDVQLPTKIYQLARILDFNAKHTCANLDQGINVVFIGASQDKVMVDSNSQPNLSLEEFFARPAAGWQAPPTKFRTVSCLSVT